jgi:hypothetical protein
MQKKNSRREPTLACFEQDFSRFRFSIDPATVRSNPGLQFSGEPRFFIIVSDRLLGPGLNGITSITGYIIYDATIHSRD